MPLAFLQVFQSSDYSNQVGHTEWGKGTGYKELLLSARAQRGSTEEETCKRRVGWGDLSKDVGATIPYAQLSNRSTEMLILELYAINFNCVCIQL